MEATTGKSDSDLVKWVHDQMKSSQKATNSWREDSEEAYAFYAGDQWSSADAQKLLDEGRPAVVFNRAARTINAVAGLEVQNRQEVRYVPRETSDNKIADYYSAVVKWARDQTDAEDEDSEAFQDALTCGMGWTQTRLDYDKDQEGMIEVSRFDPLEAFWDHAARKRNLADRKWCARVKRYYSVDDIKAEWPQYVESSHSDASQAGRYLSDSYKVKEASPPFYENKNNENQAKDPIEVICFNWYELETVYRVASPEGLVVLSEAKFSAMKETLEASGIQYVKQKKRKYQIAYVCGSQLLDKVDSPSQSGFLFNCVTGLRNRNENTWFGLMALMLDPQRWANKWLSQIMHILNSNAKGGLMAEKDAFENQAKAEKEWAKPDAITWTRPGAMQAGKIKEKQMADFPAGFQVLMQQAIDAISDTPGVNAELMGVVSREQPGVLEMTRKQAGVTMLGIFFDSLRRYRKEQGRVLADLVRDFISDGRKIRILGPDGNPQVVALMRDAMAFNSDIVVDDSPNSPSMKDKTYTILQALLPTLLKVGIQIPPEIMDYTPLPASLIEKWKEQLKPNPEKQAKQKDAEMIAREKEVSDIEKNKAEVAHKNAQTQQILFEITPEGIAVKTQLELQKHAAELQMKERLGMAEIASKERVGAMDRELQARQQETAVQ